MRKLVAGRIAVMRREGEEHGAALVAAIGVMIIALSLGALVISQAIISQRDSGRNRARTVEIHTAEAGVDSLYEQLQRGNFVCEWTTTSSDALGPDAIGAEAKIEYWDADGNELPCSGALLAHDPENPPTRAKILVTSENAIKTGAGIEPKRSFESEVLLTERRNPSAGAAIFSAGNLTMNNPGYVTGEDADVWVDTGDYNCRGNGLRIDGNLYVADGAIHLVNDCSVEGDAYVFNDIILDGGASTIRGNAYTKDGNLSIPANDAAVHGQAILGGAWITRQGSVHGGFAENQDVNPFPQSRGLPRVLYNPEDWWDDGVMVRPVSGTTPRDVYESALRDSAVANHKENGPFGNGEYCTDIQGWSIGNTVRFPEQPRGGHINPQILDARSCNVKFVGGTIEFYADTVIFAKSFDFVNNPAIVSGDGNPHQIWFIVPHDLAGSSCDIKVSSGFAPSHLLNVFLYSPCKVSFSNPPDMVGNIYGGDVVDHAGFKLEAGGMGVPGVDLLPGYVDPLGAWDVDVVYKRETGDRVG